MVGAAVASTWKVTGITVGLLAALVTTVTEPVYVLGERPVESMVTLNHGVFPPCPERSVPELVDVSPVPDAVTLEIASVPCPRLPNCV